MLSRSWPKLPIICGIATLTTLTSITDMKVPSSTDKVTSHFPAPAMELVGAPAAGGPADAPKFPDCGDAAIAISTTSSHRLAQSSIPGQAPEPHCVPASEKCAGSCAVSPQTLNQGVLVIQPPSALDEPYTVTGTAGREVQAGDMNMANSSKRILTTHTGSLPRPAELMPMVEAREEGKLTDEAAFQSQVAVAVDEIVRKQVESGVDIVNDGEVSKISYSTYVKDRLTGFEGN